MDRLAAIGHDLDLKDARFGAPEAGAIGAIVDGLQALHPDDQTLLEQGATMFEALYRALDRAERRAGPRPVARRRRKSRASHNTRPQWSRRQTIIFCNEKNLDATELKVGHSVVIDATRDSEADGRPATCGLCRLSP